MKKTTLTLTSALLILVLLVIAVLPAAAQGLQSFRKAAWGLTLRYPVGWTVDQDSPDLVNLAFQGVDDAGGIVILSDPIYANPDYNLEDVFWDILSKLGGEAENVDVQPGDTLTIAGAEARSAIYTAIISGTDVEGDLFIFAKGKSGFAIATASLSATWDVHAPEFESILNSIRIGGAATPTRTPTRAARRMMATPTKARPKPTATPTEEVAPTEEPTEKPTMEPAPTEETIEQPTAKAIEEPTEEPTQTATPTDTATPTRTAKPAATPTKKPTATPTALPAATTAAITTTTVVTSTQPLTVTTPITTAKAITATTPITPARAITATTPITLAKSITATTGLTLTGALSGTAPITGTVPITAPAPARSA